MKKALKVFLLVVIALAVIVAILPGDDEETTQSSISSTSSSTQEETYDTSNDEQTDLNYEEEETDEETYEEETTENEKIETENLNVKKLNEGKYFFVAKGNYIGAYDISEKYSLKFIQSVKLPISFQPEDIVYDGRYTYTPNLTIIDWNNIEKPEITYKGYNIAGFSKIKIDKNYAYIYHKDKGILIYDISNKNKPEKLGKFNIKGIYNYFIKDRYMYISGKFEIDDKAYLLLIVDIKDKTNPKIIGKYRNKHEEHDYDQVGYNIYIKDNYAIILEPDKIEIVDISSKSNIRSVKNIDVGGYSGSFYDSSLKSGKAFVDEYKNYIVAGDFKYLFFIDLNKKKIIKAFTVYSNRKIIIGDYLYSLYLVDNSGFLKIFNISNINVDKLEYKTFSFEYFNFEIYKNNLYVFYKNDDYSTGTRVDLKNKSLSSIPQILRPTNYAFYKYFVRKNNEIIYVGKDRVVINEMKDENNIKRTVIKFSEIPELKNSGKTNRVLVDRNKDYVYIIFREPVMIKVLDISDKDFPEVVGELKIENEKFYGYDWPMVRDLNVKGGIRDGEWNRCTDGKYLYLSTTDNLYIVELSENPSIVGKINTPGYILGKGGNYLIVQEGKKDSSGRRFSLTDKLVFIDISDKNNPEIANTIELKGDFSNWEISENKMVYFKYNNNRKYFIDFSDINNIKESEFTFTREENLYSSDDNEYFMNDSKFYVLKLMKSINRDYADIFIDIYDISDITQIKKIKEIELAKYIRPFFSIFEKEDSGIYIYLKYSYIIIDFDTDNDKVNRVMPLPISYAVTGR
ncbi:hypothetical protein Marpi_1983 [Marinitoga piezophila KA3]|uniref:LVIVD repeat protein n=1 Tax=Marinitoga piezophila (strain DSM 14283 / JCM 11233 / KA3) TaxID=443254 RepID=H2J6S8_MARPK|nr:beta-propeller domain-containing protein [Marinitoga piezophila]AEX86359.1 hypothetical protein Marpi_1983 [Marinitoga piezophila KA3]